MPAGRILVTGGSGQLGSAFRRQLPDATFLDRSGLDLSRPEVIAATLDEVGPGVIINCAAYTAVDDAEDFEALATVVNGEAVGEMARWASTHGARLVTFSTDYVFDGESSTPYVESSPTEPINAYGRSKLAGEAAALRYDGSLVVRTSWLISGRRPNFVATMLDFAAAGRNLTVVDDQLGSPTIAADLAAFTTTALDGGVVGIVHATNQGTTTWFGLARAAVEVAGFDTALITPCTTADYPTRAKRPSYSVLGSERDLGLGPMPLWSDSLPGVVAALRSDG